MANLTHAEWKIKQAITYLILTQPFYGTLALRLRLLATDHVPNPNGIGMKRLDKIMTDGIWLAYNEGWVEGLAQDELCGEIAHVITEVAFGLIWRRGDRDFDRWAIACDFAVNPILRESGFKLPADALYNDKWAGWPTEKIYPLIQQKPSEQQKQASKWGQCDHNVNPSGPGQPGDGEGDGDEGEDGGSDVRRTGIGLQAEWEIAVIQAANAAKMQGNIPANLQRLVDEIVKPTSDWRSHLRKFVQICSKNDYSWMRPSVKYLSSADIYLPSLYSESMPGICVGDDTSGSIDREVTNVFQAELSQVMLECSPEWIEVLHCDAHVHSTERFEAGDEILLHPKGGGGTSFVPVFQYIEKKELQPICLIYFTDMMGEFPKSAPSYPTLWASTTQGVEGPFGETIYISV